MYIFAARSTLNATNLFAMNKFINPFSDFGFKKIFGSEVSKDLIISFLNGVLHDEIIVNITFRNVEMLGMKSEQRRVVFDGSDPPRQISLGHRANGSRIEDTL